MVLTPILRSVFASNIIIIYLELWGSQRVYESWGAGGWNLAAVAYASSTTCTSLQYRDGIYCLVVYMGAD